MWLILDSKKNYKLYIIDFKAAQRLITESLRYRI